MQAQSQVRGGCEARGRAWSKGEGAMEQANGRFGRDARGKGVCGGKAFRRMRVRCEWNDG